MRKLLSLLLVLISINTLQAQVSDAEASLAKQIVNRHAAAIGINSTDLENSIVSSTYQHGSGIRMIYLQQSFKNIPVFNSMQVLAFRDDKLVSATGNRIQSVEKLVNSIDGVPSLNPVEAVGIALREEKINITDPLNFQGMKGRKLDYGRVNTYENITAELIWYPVDDKVKLVWQVLVAPEKTDDMWLTKVDALTGQIVAKHNLTIYDDWHQAKNLVTRQQEDAPRTWISTGQWYNNNLPIVNGASYLVIKYPAESPQHPGGTAQVHTDPWNMSPGNATSLKWHSTGATDYNITRGNNVWATEDRAAANQNTGLPATSSTPDPLTFNFPPDYLVAPTTAQFQQFAITNLFYWNNLLHDVTYIYGFDEVSGNFQVNNQGRGGLGNDDVMALAQSGAGTNNANFNTPDDGQRGRMRMYLWTAPNPDRDGDIDNGIVSHEFTHGVSNRLTGGPGNSSCLQNAEQGGEGWSDYIGLMVTTNWATATLTDGALARGIGTYALNQPVTGVGIRTFPYSTNLAINPRIYSSNLPSAVHTLGEYWCAALWEMTWEMIQLDGINPNLFNPSGTGGNSAAFKLVIEGMRLQPCNPGFIDARDGILRADTLFFGAHYSCAIWKAFAKRGMGRGASQGSSNSVTDQIPSFIVDNGFFKVTENLMQVPEGGNVTYTNNITAGNCTPMNNYFITDTLPTHVTWVSGGTYNAGNRTVTLGPVNLSTGQSQNFPFTVTVNPGSYFVPVTHFTENVTGATIPASWTANPATGNAWGVSNLQSQSPPNSFFAPDPVVVSDMTLATTSAYTLAPTGASSYSTLTFWHRFNTEDGWDGGVVEISTNGGGSWTDLGSRMISGKYNGSLGTGSALANRQAFTGNNGAFMKTVVNLSSFTGQTVNIRFRFASDNNTAPAGGGWFVDDIVLTTEPAVYMKSNLFNSTNQLQSVTDTLTRITPPVAGCTPIVITTHPANINSCDGGSANFTVAVTGTAPVFQWQVNTGSGFTNISSSPTYAGTTTSTLTISGVTLAMNGYQYRCEVSNTCTSPINSNAGTLSVGVTASVQTQPNSSSVCEGANTSFVISATGATSYQWQVNTGSGFINVQNVPPYSGATTATLTITGATLLMNTYQYRVVLGSCPSNFNSNAVTLTVLEQTSISRQPLNASVCEGANANFSVTAAGAGVTYQWQVSTNGGGSFSNISGANAATLTLNAVTLAQFGNQYRCVVTGSCGVLNSTAGILVVNPTPAFTLGANPSPLCISDTAITLSASVNGGVWSGTGIQGSRFVPGAAGVGTFTITYTVTNSAGCSASKSMLIQVNECPERHVTLDKQHSIIVYSNPNNGRFNIWVKTDLYTRLGLRVYNSAGQLMKTESLSNVYYDKKIPVDLSRFAGGVYHLYLYNDETGKLVKKIVGIVISH